MQSNTCETQVSESIPLIDVTVSHSSSRMHPYPCHLVFSSSSPGNSSQLMPSALQPFFYSCLVSSSRLYFEVVRSYPRRGKALPSIFPTPAFSLSLPPSEPLLRAPITASISGLSRSPSCRGTASVLPSVPSIPIPRSPIYTFLPPPRPIRHRRWQAGCISPFNLDSTATTCHDLNLQFRRFQRLHPPTSTLPSLPPGEEAWGRILSELGSSPCPVPSRLHARTACTTGTHTHTHKEMHTARVPDPGLLPVRPFSTP